MSIKLIAIDVDGTLVRSDLSIGERTLRAIEKSKDAGILVTLSTGRMVSATERYLHELSIDMPIVALNGSIVKGLDGDVPVYHEPLPEKAFDSILPVLSKSVGATILVRCDSSFGWNIDERLKEILSSWIVGIEDISPEESPRKPTIAMVAGMENLMRDTFDEIKKLELEGIQYFLFPSIRYYPMWYLEVRAANVDKGSGLKALCKKFDIEPDETLAIGDFLNDLSMFEFAGHTAAVANAHQDVIDVADYVSPLSCDRDGVAEIIEKLVFKQ